MERKKIFILGGGTAGWMTAAAFARFLDKNIYSINVIESDQIGIVGVGEATIPHIRYFNNMLGIQESDFLRAVSATFKLGIQFENWGSLNSCYIHPFGSHGYPIGDIDFHHYWLAAKQYTKELPKFDDFSLASVMAKRGRFTFPDEKDELKASFSYAYHIDAGRYAIFLRSYAEEKCVRRIEGRVEKVKCSTESGVIEKLILDDGQVLDGDWFIDCSGFRSLLLGAHLNVEYEDWSKWLPCDRAISPRQSVPDLFTRAIAKEWGWQWCIPLQHRTGNGVVYSSSFVSDQAVLDSLLVGIGEPLVEPNFLRFKAGCRSKFWEKNCIAIGLSSGFLEPLESTSIYLIQQGIFKFLEYFPSVGAADLSPLMMAYNKEMYTEYNRIKDFLILHYHLTSRNDSEFWKYCRNIVIPDSLQRKMNLFKTSAHIESYEFGLFMQPSWLALFLGQDGGVTGFDRRVTRAAIPEIMRQLWHMRDYLASYTDKLPPPQTVLINEMNVSSGVVRQAAANLYGVDK